MKNRVAFVMYCYPLGVSSMIINSVKLFAERGVAVDIYIDSGTLEASPAIFAEDNVRIIEFATSPPGRLLARFLSLCSRVILKISRASIIKWRRHIPSKLIRLLYLEDYFFSAWLRSRIGVGYDYIFPVEAKALISTTGFRARIVYYNMEMLDWAEVNPIYGKDKMLLKILESKALKGTEAVVIQNDARAEQFRKINDYSKKIHILPVAAMGEPVDVKGTYLREKFNIPEDKRIAIYSGNIMPWARCLEMVESVKDWPDDFCFVTHTWRRNAFDTEYGLELKKAAEGLPVYFSDDYLDLDELPALLGSADVALMFYEPIDTNFLEILFSSNKLAEYLKAGLPVITSDFPELRKFISETGIGSVVGAMTEIPRALNEITERYDEYRRNVISCYQSKFRFERFFEPLYSELFQSPDRRG